MKSIMEEASSVSKAIETAWQRAGNPEEFSIKVLELPQTKFFGLKTSKSAKIALFFSESPVRRMAADQATPKQSRHQGQARTAPSKQESSEGAPRRSYQQRADHGERSHEPRAHTPHQERRPANPRPHQERNRQNQEHREPRRQEHSYERQERPERQEPREGWTPEMIATAQEWLKETLVLMGKPEITFNVQPSHNYLKIYLSEQVLPDTRQEETQLKSWGSLAMEAVREKAHKPLRNLRIVIESKR